MLRGGASDRAESVLTVGDVVSLPIPTDRVPEEPGKELALGGRQVLGGVAGGEHGFFCPWTYGRADVLGGFHHEWPAHGRVVVPGAGGPLAGVDVALKVAGGDLDGVNGLAPWSPPGGTGDAAGARLDLWVVLSLEQVVGEGHISHGHEAVRVRVGMEEEHGRIRPRIARGHADACGGGHAEVAAREDGDAPRPCVAANLLALGHEASNGDLR